MAYKKYAFLLNKQTAAVVILSFVSAYLSLLLKFRIYIDFLILGLIVVFPLTLTIKEAFKRRERAIKSLCALKAALTAQFYVVEFANIQLDKKKELSGRLMDISSQLNQFLVSKTGDESIVRSRIESIVRFLRKNHEELKEKHLSKLLSNLEDIHEEVEFLIATKKHHTPESIRTIVLFAMTVFKSVILISLYNTQVLFENTFRQTGTDNISIKEFEFKGWTDPSMENYKSEKEKMQG